MSSADHSGGTSGHQRTNLESNDEGTPHQRGSPTGRITTATTGRQGQPNDGSTPANFADLDQQDPPSIPNRNRRWSLEPLNPPADHGREDIGGANALLAFANNEEAAEEDPIQPPILPPPQPQPRQPLPPQQHRYCTLDLRCEHCNTAVTVRAFQCRRGACNNNRDIYCSETCIGHHRCNPLPTHEVYTFHDINNSIWTDPNSNQHRKKECIYIRRIKMDDNERLELQRVVNEGYDLPTSYLIATTFHVGNTVDAQKRTWKANTDNAAEFEQLIIPTIHRARVEAFLLYVLHERGLRRGSGDHFILSQEDITTINNKIGDYQNDGVDLVITFYDPNVQNQDDFVPLVPGSNHNRSESIKYFADDDRERFNQWWQTRGRHSGIAKPETSAKYLQTYGKCRMYQYQVVYINARI